MVDITYLCCLVSVFDSFHENILPEILSQGEGTKRQKGSIQGENHSAEWMTAQSIIGVEGRNFRHLEKPSCRSLSLDGEWETGRTVVSGRGMDLSTKRTSGNVRDAPEGSETIDRKNLARGWKVPQPEGKTKQSQRSRRATPPHPQLCLPYPWPPPGTSTHSSHECFFHTYSLTGPT